MNGYIQVATENGKFVWRFMVVSRDAVYGQLPVHEVIKSGEAESRDAAVKAAEAFAHLWETGRA